MPKPLEYFTDRIGKTILRDGRECKIHNQPWAVHLFETQSAYTTIADTEMDFDLPEVASSTPTKPRIHMATESVCVACEG